MRLIDADNIKDTDIIFYLGTRYSSCLPDIRDLIDEQPTVCAIPISGCENKLVTSCAAPEMCKRRLIAYLERIKKNSKDILTNGVCLSGRKFAEFVDMLIENIINGEVI